MRQSANKDQAFSIGLAYLKLDNYFYNTCVILTDNGGYMFKKFINALIDQPLLASIFIADLAVLSLHKPPFLFSVVMLAGLVGMCLYYGQKLAIFQINSDQN